MDNNSNKNSNHLCFVLKLLLVEKTINYLKNSVC